MIAETAGLEAAIFRRASGHAGGDTSDADEDRADGGTRASAHRHERGRAPKRIQHPASTNAQDASVARLTPAGATGRITPLMSTTLRRRLLATAL